MCNCMLYCSDIEMAEAVPDIDIIVGGHTHSFLYTSKVQVNMYMFLIFLDKNEDLRICILMLFLWRSYINRHC